MACHPDPTAAEVVLLAVAGHKAAHAARVDGQDRKRLPIPAEFVKRVLLVGVYTKDVELARRCCGLVRAYVLFNRPGAAADMRFKDFRVTAAGIECQVRSFKGGVRQGAERIAVVVPFSVTNARGGDDVINLLVRLLNEHTVVGRRPDERLFAPGHLPAAERARDLGAGATSIWLAELLARLNVSPPLGGAYSGQSLRSGAASAAFSLGFSVEVVADLCAHNSTATTLRYCIAVRFRATPTPLPVRGWMMVGDPYSTPDGTFAKDVIKLHTFVLGHHGALLLACFGFDLRFALVAFDLVSDSIWCEGVGVGVGARGGSTWAGGDYLRGALGWKKRANLRTTNKARSHTHTQAQFTQPLHRGPPIPILTAFQQWSLGQHDVRHTRGSRCRGLARLSGGVPLEGARPCGGFHH